MNGVKRDSKLTGATYRAHFGTDDSTRDGISRTLGVAGQCFEVETNHKNCNLRIPSQTVSSTPFSGIFFSSLTNTYIHSITTASTRPLLCSHHTQMHRSIMQSTRPLRLDQKYHTISTTPSPQPQATPRCNKHKQQNINHSVYVDMPACNKISIPSLSP